MGFTRLPGNRSVEEEEEEEKEAKEEEETEQEEEDPTMENQWGPGGRVGAILCG